MKLYNAIMFIRLYHEELLKARANNEKLGVGIALFQGLSNVAINGELFSSQDLTSQLLSLSLSVYA